MNSDIRKICRLCNSSSLHTFLNLAPTPPANNYAECETPQEYYPLDVAICEKCKHVQLITILSPSLLYSHYDYTSSASKTMKEHLEREISKFCRFLNLQNKDTILEIGCNDGTCIKKLLNEGFINVIGVDPATNICKQNRDLPIINNFFGNSCVDEIKACFNNFKLIFAFHCCAHIEDIKSVFEAVYTLLDSEGVFIFEVGYFGEVFRQNTFDTIYHEHIDYHTVKAMSNFVNLMKMKLFHVERNNIQGGSIQFYISKNILCKERSSVNELLKLEQKLDVKTLQKWSRPIIKNGYDFRILINGLVDDGNIIAGYGAPAKATTLLHQYKLSKKDISFIVDDNLLKQNKLIPGLHIPIKSSEYFALQKVDYIIILAWNMVDEIIGKLTAFRENGGRVIIPFPRIIIM
jgi:SAM-dependent methyltransferase